MTPEEWEAECRRRLALFLDIADVAADGPPQGGQANEHNDGRRAEEVAHQAVKAIAEITR